MAYGHRGWFNRHAAEPATLVRQPGGAPARAELTRRFGAMPGVEQHPRSDRPDPYASGRRVGQQSRRRFAREPRPAREEMDRRAEASDDRGRVAFGDYLPAGRGRASRPATPLPSAEPDRTRTGSAFGKVGRLTAAATGGGNGKARGLFGRLFAGGER